MNRGWVGNLGTEQVKRGGKAPTTTAPLKLSVSARQQTKRNASNAPRNCGRGNSKRNVKEATALNAGSAPRFRGIKLNASRIKRSGSNSCSGKPSFSSVNCRYNASSKCNGSSSNSRRSGSKAEAEADRASSLRKTKTKTKGKARDRVKVGRSCRRRNVKLCASRAASN